jgi:hypothetical protein
MNKIQSSWELIKASFSVLQSDKELIIFPIVSSIGTLIVTLSFAIPMMLAGVFEYIFSDIPGANIVGFVILFLFYIFQYFIVIFSNSALVGAAMIRLKGGDPTVSDGFRIALQNIKSIFGFAVISATVGMILRMISERSNTLGRFVISLIGLAWNLATFLVIPVLVVEGIGPIESVKRSVALLKRTWGEQIAGNIGFGLFFGLLTIGILITAIPITIFLLVADSRGWHINDIHAIFSQPAQWRIKWNFYSRSLPLRC